MGVSLLLRCLIRKFRKIEICLGHTFSYVDFSGVLTQRLVPYFKYVLARRYVINLIRTIALGYCKIGMGRNHDVGNHPVMKVASNFDDLRFFPSTKTPWGTGTPTTVTPGQRTAGSSRGRAAVAAQGSLSTVRGCFSHLFFSALWRTQHGKTPSPAALRSAASCMNWCPCFSFSMSRRGDSNRGKKRRQILPLRSVTEKRYKLTRPIRM